MNAEHCVMTKWKCHQEQVATQVLTLRRELTSTEHQ